MCLALFATNRLGFKTILASSRDESSQRETVYPKYWRHQRIFAGQDVSSKGTWLGINRHGILAIVFNQYGAKHAEGKNSRGQLVLDVLNSPTIDHAESTLKSVNSPDYTGFSMLCSTLSGEAIFRTFDGQVLTSDIASSLSNYTPKDVDKYHKTEYYKREFLQTLEAHPGEHSPSQVVEMLHPLLRDHRPHQDPRTSACVHDEGYQTVSSTIVLSKGTLSDTYYFYTDGAPCLNDYSDLTRSLTSLLD